ncbi:UDP-N-acetylmuramoylalanyl-D-glutamyl-2,6-diaminopimelate--D-alanyl-D-alanine ligase [Enterovirga aerilata]|uniref:UDP-N-acetylmuramoyl-tripeptide--D-alanyl-D-alanine ligase n=1 Tax=Enterovirga aerilata TaxID=2730920 RepID=A0A849HTL3_9HYPH|nr:UDP-N-acetylmuramoylalanyl-D-glutamyl-2,6-diaminopimelate--D-alanyl-D-alanine ligase [Enterovirga sp. DB1703]NNM70836.1 UDP-N-acetylmuramoylalanyl-D-glutamyl-2,6-diaminopimelate--D-alanyl-D-alanine ligase [Enterovirga sp. DB1703]
MTAPLWTREDVETLGGRIVGSFDAATGVSIDTRTIQPGDLFVAIAGEARDGHDFVRAAIERHAAAAIVAEGKAGSLSDAGPLVVVPDPLDFMRRLGCTARARTAARVLAVTGSVGKTGTKEALRLVLSRFGETHASVASYNNHWGVPLTLARIPKDSRFGVFEIGMNHAGEIAPLTRMVRPEVAVVTTIEPVHIGHFRSILGIADAKAEIFEGLEPGGVAVINRDNPYFDRLLAHAAASNAGRVISFGEHEAADVRALRIATGPDASMVEANVLGRTAVYRVGAAGRHMALNSLAVLAAAAALGLDPNEAAGGLAELSAPVGRGERIRLRHPDGEFLAIDESFNANPASMRAALATLATVEARGRRIAVLADMGELGEMGPKAHADLAEAVVASKADLVFAAGPLMRGLWDALPARLRGAYAQSAAELEGAVLDAVRPGDAVMIKGSKFTQVSKIVAALKRRFGQAQAAATTGRG